MVRLSRKEKSILNQTNLFRQINQDDMETMLGCLTPRLVDYFKGEFIFREEDKIQEAGVVLSGRVHIMQEDFWGNTNLLSVVEAGQMFGEVYACLKNEPLQVSIRADQDTRVLFLNLSKVMHVCSNNCIFHQNLTENLVYSVAKQSLYLTEKIQVTARRSTREKVLAYLSAAARKQDSSYITLPLNRQQMADFLSVDRSALSRELARMQEEGLIEYHQNQFRLIDNGEK